MVIHKKKSGLIKKNLASHFLYVRLNFKPLLFYGMRSKNASLVRKNALYPFVKLLPDLQT